MPVEMAMWKMTSDGPLAIAPKKLNFEDRLAELVVNDPSLINLSARSAPTSSGTGSHHRLPAARIQRRPQPTGTSCEAAPGPVGTSTKGPAVLHREHRRSPRAQIDDRRLSPRPHDQIHVAGMEGDRDETVGSLLPTVAPPPNRLLSPKRCRRPDRSCDDLDLLRVPPSDFEIRCATHPMHRRK
jgi:hypothetical protein